MQNVTEISIQSFIDEVFKFTYLIADTTQVTTNAQNQDLLVQKEKSIKSNCVYMYRIDKYLFWFIVIIHFATLCEKGHKILISDNWENSG